MTTRGFGEPRRCPVASCGRTVRAGHLMCAAHWREVPKALQRNVWTYWRRWNRDHDDDTWEAYMGARTAALESVGGEG